MISDAGYQNKRWYFRDPSLTWSPRSLRLQLELRNPQNATTVFLRHNVEILWGYIVSCKKKLHDRLWHPVRSYLEVISTIRKFSVEWFIQHKQKDWVGWMRLASVWTWAPRRVVFPDFLILKLCISRLTKNALCPVLHHQSVTLTFASV